MAKCQFWISEESKATLSLPAKFKPHTLSDKMRAQNMVAMTFFDSGMVNFLLSKKVKHNSECFHEVCLGEINTQIDRLTKAKYPP